MCALPYITVIVDGHADSDGFTIEIGSNGIITIEPGLPDFGPPSVLGTEGASHGAKHAARKSTYEDFKNAAYILKHAAQIKDPKLREAAIFAAREYFIGETASEILGPNGNVIAIF
jgi:hypothetical protein